MMTTQTLTVSSHTRRKPLDPHAEAKARTHALLREYVQMETKCKLRKERVDWYTFLLRNMEREIEEIVKEGLRNGY